MRALFSNGSNGSNGANGFKVPSVLAKLGGWGPRVLACMLDILCLILQRKVARSFRSN